MRSPFAEPLDQLFGTTSALPCRRLRVFTVQSLDDREVGAFPPHRAQVTTHALTHAIRDGFRWVVTVVTESAEDERADSLRNSQRIGSVFSPSTSSVVSMRLPECSSVLTVCHVD